MVYALSFSDSQNARDSTSYSTKTCVGRRRQSGNTYNYMGGKLFVCFVALRPSQHLWSVNLATLFLGKLEQATNQYFVHILALIT